MAELRGRDTTGRWLDPESDGPRGSGEAKRSRRGSPEFNEEFGGRVIRPPKDARVGSAVEQVDFAGAVSGDKADVQKVVRDSRVGGEELREAAECGLRTRKPLWQAPACRS